MLERILVPLDGSETAEAILPRLAPLALETGSELVLLLVVWPGSIAVLPTVPLNELLDEAQQRGREYLRPLQDALRARGLRTCVDVPLDQPVQGILGAVRKHDPSMIAMMTHGRSGAMRWLLGSVAERVLRASPVPVLLMRSFEANPDGSPRARPSSPWIPSRILVPVNGTESGETIAPMVAGLADLFSADVDLLMVVPSPSDYGATSRAEGALERSRTVFARAGVEAETHLRHAPNVSDAILDYAQRVPEIGLIAMRTHGRDGVARWVLGSIAEELVRRARVPVLVARQRSKQRSEWDHAGAFAAGVERDL